MAERSHAGLMQATAKWRQVEFSGDWGPASWSIREIRDSQLKLTWGRAAGPVPVEGDGARAGPTVPQMPTPGTVVSPICESLLSLNVLAIWEFGLIGCQRSQGGWPAGIREKKGKESKRQLVSSQAPRGFWLHSGRPAHSPAGQAAKDGSGERDRTPLAGRWRPAAPKIVSENYIISDSTVILFYHSLSVPRGPPGESSFLSKALSCEGKATVRPQLVAWCLVFSRRSVNHNPAAPARLAGSQSQLLLLHRDLPRLWAAWPP